MQQYEVNALIEFIPYLDRNSWERCRYNMFTNIQMNSTKKIEATDIIKFAWDNTDTTNTTSISNYDKERLQEKSKLISNKI